MKTLSELNKPSWVLVNRSGDHFKMRDIGRTGYVCKFDWHCWLWRGLSITNEWNGRDSLSGGNHAEPINGSWHIRLRMGSVQVGCRLNEYQWNQVNIYIYIYIKMSNIHILILLEIPSMVDFRISHFTGITLTIWLYI